MVIINGIEGTALTQSGEKIATGLKALSNADKRTLVTDIQGVARAAGASSVAGQLLVASTKPGEVTYIPRSDIVGWFDVTEYGARGDGVNDDQPAINSAIAAAVAAGGGTVYIPPGTYRLTNSNGAAASWDNHRALYVGGDNVHIVGAGSRATKLVLAVGANCHVIKFGSRATSVVTVSHCSVRDLEIDGNRANQQLPEENEDHWQGIDVSSGCQRITLRDLYIHDCQYYGIGMQRTAISNCAIENAIIANTGSDGIDWKNDDGDGRGNVIRSVHVHGHGLATGLALGLAGVDVRSGVTVDDILVTGMTAEADLVGVRFQRDANADEADLPVYPSSGRRITVNGDNGASSYGIRVASRNMHLSDIRVTDCANAMRVSVPDAKISNFDLIGNTYGIVLTQGTTGEADNHQFVNGTVRACTTTGVLLQSVDEVTFTNVDVRSNVTGYDIQSGSTNIRIIGGSIFGNTTDVIDSGSDTIIQAVSAYRTRSARTVTVAIDTTGVKSFTIQHFLPFTPNMTDVALCLNKTTAVTDWEMGFLEVTSVDADNVYGQLRVLAASATGSAVVTVVAHVHGKTFV